MCEKKGEQPMLHALVLSGAAHCGGASGLLARAGRGGGGPPAGLWPRESAAAGGAAAAEAGDGVGGATPETSSQKSYCGWTKSVSHHLAAGQKLVPKIEPW